jgi:GNAT superfamily N-acetyltransferase
VSVKFAVELFDSWWHEAEPLFKRHKAELASLQESELAINMGFYKRANELGMTMFFTARDDGRLVGYAIYHVQPNLHYMKEVWASSDTIIIMPEYRRQGLGDPFYEFIRERIRDLSAMVIQTSVRADHPEGRALGMLLVRHGCARLNIGYAERLG